MLLLFVALATWYSLTIPLGEAPDEVPHFTYVRYLAQQRHLPTTTEEHEAFQPPLYYVSGAAATFWIEDEPGAPFAVRANADYSLDPRAPKNLLLHTSAESWPYRGWVLAWHLARLLSIALGAVTVWAVYRLGRTLFPGWPALSLTMAALTAFTPQFLFMSAVVNNDNAATAFSALVLWQGTALLLESNKNGGSRSGSRAAILGLLLGLGLLSKASLAALLPVAGLAVVVSALRSQTPKAIRRVWRAVYSLLFVAALVAAITAWYFIRNWRLFGDPLGWSFLLQTNALREGPLDLGVLGWLLRGVFRSFWLGWIGIAFDEAIYWLIGAACLVGLAGSAAWLVQSWKGMTVERRWALALLGFHAAITLGSLIQWTATVLGTDQGRLIYPMLPTVMLVLVSGWAWWVRGAAPRIVAVVAGRRAGSKHGSADSKPEISLAWLVAAPAFCMLVLAVVTPVRYIAPVHAPAPVASPAELEAARPLNVSWNGLRLLGYRLEGTGVKPGGTIVLDLYWEGLEVMDRDLMALIQLVDSEGKFLMYTDGSPTAGRDTTDRWTPGIALASRHLLGVPGYGTPGDYRLTISLHPFGEQAWLLALGPDGSVLGERLTLPETIRLVAP